MSKKAIAKIFHATLLVAGIVATIIGAYTIIQSELPTPTTFPSLTPTPTPQQTQEATPTATTTPSITSSPTPRLTITPSTPPTSTPTPNLTPTSNPSPSPSPIPMPATAKATNWAGYIVATNIQSPQPNITGVSASWIVPAVTASTNDTFSSAWIGVGGEFDRSLIQCGTQQDYFRGQTVYSAWYELLPRYAITINSINISPGDQIKASIQLVNSTLNQWSINLIDVTTGRSFQNTVTYESSQSSADWIIERPTINGAITPLANFGNITFTECQASFGSVSGGISSFPSAEIVMYTSIDPDIDGVQLTDVSNLGADGSSFTVNYLTTS